MIVAPDISEEPIKLITFLLGCKVERRVIPIDFGSLKTYFGFFWEAADFGNSVAFYNGNVLQGYFRHWRHIRWTAFRLLWKPKYRLRPFEAFVYLNFTSTDLASRFDRVVFMNGNLLTGFETDNHSTYDQIIPPPGVPEPSTYALMASGLPA